MQTQRIGTQQRDAIPLGELKRIKVRLGSLSKQWTDGLTKSIRTIDAKGVQGQGSLPNDFDSGEALNGPKGAKISPGELVRMMESP